MFKVAHGYIRKSKLIVFMALLYILAIVFYCLLQIILLKFLIAFVLKSHHYYTSPISNLLILLFLNFAIKIKKISFATHLPNLEISSFDNDYLWLMHTFPLVWFVKGLIVSFDGVIVKLLFRVTQILFYLSFIFYVHLVCLAWKGML